MLKITNITEEKRKSTNSAAVILDKALHAARAFYNFLGDEAPNDVMKLEMDTETLFVKSIVRNGLMVGLDVGLNTDGDDVDDVIGILTLEMGAGDDKSIVLVSTMEGERMPISLSTGRPAAEWYFHLTRLWEAFVRAANEWAYSEV